MASRWNQDLFKRALDFAARAHGDQRVPGSNAPYVVHVTKVATEVLNVLDDSIDSDLALTCALLHDTIEDAGITHEMIAAEFGKPAADGVQALTKDETLPKPQRMADSLARIRLQPTEVWLVKLADRITNLESPPPAWSLEKRRAYHAEARSILDALGSCNAEISARFERKLSEYTAWLALPQ